MNLELLEPTACHLVEMWDNDECDFIDVTIGVGRLQKLLAIFNETYTLPELETRRRVMMATTPGNQHSFGASMIESLLSAAGWQVDAEYSGNADDIINAVSHNWFAVIGLTAGSDRQLEALKSIIVEIRTNSQNRAIGIWWAAQCLPKIRRWHRRWEETQLLLMHLRLSLRHKNFSIWLCRIDGDGTTQNFERPFRSFANIC